MMKSTLLAGVSALGMAFAGAAHGGRRHRRRSAQRRHQHQAGRDQRHGPAGPPLQPAQADQHHQRQGPRPGLVLLLRRRKAARPGSPGPGARRRRLYHRLLQPHLYAMDAKTGDKLWEYRRPSARRHHALLRRDQPRSAHLWRQGLFRHARRPDRRARRQDRQEGLAQGDRRLQGRLFLFRRAADRPDQGQWRADHHRRVRRRIRRRRPRRGPQCRHRRTGVDAVPSSRA